MAEHTPWREIEHKVKGEDLKRMKAALRQIGYSAHSGRPRMGPKAQVARWGLGEDTHPDEGADG